MEKIKLKKIHLREREREREREIFKYDNTINSNIFKNGNEVN